MAAAITAAALTGLMGGTAAAGPHDTPDTDQGKPTAAGLARPRPRVADLAVAGSRRSAEESPEAAAVRADFAAHDPLDEAVATPLIAKARRVLILLDDGAPLDDGELTRLRDQLATAAAGQVGQDPGAMRAAWARSDRAHLTALMAAITQIGVPYRAMRSSAGVGFDCSGLTKYAWGRAGRSIGRTSRDQIRRAEAVGPFQAQAGDLVYYPGHVMLTLGVGNAIIHSPYTGQRVRFDHTRRKNLRFGDPSAAPATNG